MAASRLISFLILLTLGAGCATTPPIPALWVDRLAGGIDRGSTTAILAPVAGSEVLALVRSRDERQYLGPPQVQLRFRPPIVASTRTVSVAGKIDPAAQLLAGPGYSAVRFVIPDAPGPGPAELSLRLGKATTGWIDFEVTNPEAATTRRALMEQVASALSNSAAKQRVVAGWNPLPPGAEIRDGWSGDLVRQITEDTWLFMAFDPNSHFAQTGVTWILAKPGQALDILPGRDVWPDVIDGKTGEQLGSDWSDPSTLNNQFFEASPGGSDRPWHQQEPPTAPPTHATITGTGLTGLIADPCPGGITSLALVLQLNDKGGFEWLGGEVERIFQERGANVTRVRPRDLVHKSTHGYRETKLVEQIRQLARRATCPCTEVIIIVISHGKNDHGHSLLLFRHGYTNNRDGKEVKTKEIRADEMVELIAKVFHEEKKDCVPVSLVLHACFSGAALDEVEDSVRDGSAGANSKFRVIASSGEDEKSYGNWDGGGGNPDVFFFRALEACLADPSLDTSPHDGTVSLEEAWPCIVERTRTAAGGLGKPQNPGKVP